MVTVISDIQIKNNPNTGVVVEAKRVSILDTGALLDATNVETALAELAARPIAGGAGSGFVTSVGLILPDDYTVAGSPVTVSGNIVVTRDIQTAGSFLASPTGASGVPSYRGIVADDIPNPLNQDTTGMAAGISGSGYVAISHGGTGAKTRQAAIDQLTEPILYAVGHVLTVVDENHAVFMPSGVSGGGTVTSIELGDIPPWLSETSNPVTSSGALSFEAETHQVGNSVLATAITNVDGPLTVRKLVGADLPDGGVTYARMQDATASKLLGRGSDAGTGVVQEIVLGDNLSMDGTTLILDGGGDLIAGTNVILSGTLTNRLVGAGDVTVQATGGSGAGITRLVFSISSAATAGSVASIDEVYFVTGTTTLTLPTAVGNINRYTIKSISGTTTVACDGAETIDGTETIVIANEDSVDLVSNNSVWKVL